MDKPKKLTTKKVILILVAVFLVCGCILGGVALAQNRVKKVATDEEFTYVNPDETKAEADEGFTIDGVFDEEQYQNNNWLYLHNTDKYADVDVTMTNYFGEKGMYFAYDVTDRKSVYVNLERSSTMNSCIEMYLATNSTLSKSSNHLFEIDLLPTGDMSFKKTNGKGGFENVMTSNDIMAYLGATTKGGAVNTKECTGYCLELFIPWEYMEKFGIDTEEIKKSYIYVTPAHITSFNYDGTDGSNDRYWYFFAEQQGASMDTVYQYFRFNEDGVIGTTPTKVVEGEHCSITGDPVVIPGMKTTYTITPEEGYAVNSVLVNGKEYIQHVSYNEEGAALLTIRGKEEGLEIKATAETVTEGTKTLSGTVEVDGGSLSGVSVSYKGVNGKKAIEIDKNGKFVLSNLQQGYYKITVEKEGYEKLERGIYLNRDITTELDFVVFNVETGKSWVLDAQEDNVLYKFGGRGIILSKDSYNKFTVEVNLKYNEELAKEYDHTYFTEQRQGIRIKFSNEKYWDINLLLQDGKYRLQYAALAGKDSVFTSYKNIYYMTEEEIAMYKGKDGVKLKVLRDGKYANLYLNDKLISIEVLEDEYAKCSAQVGFEAWTANRVVEEYKYQISTDTKGIITNTLFRTSAGWDISGQFDGYLSMPTGGNGNISFVDQYANINLALKVRDYQNSTDKEGVNPRTDVLFVFENGAHISFGITTFNNGAVAIQSVNNGADDGKQICKRFKDWGHMKDDEKAQYLAEGIDFRVVRYGTDILLYIGDRFVKVADLTENNSGVTADMKATVSIRHWDDTGVNVIIPFELTTDVNPIKITSVESTYGKVVGDRNTYFVGDKITLSGKGKEGYYCTSMKVNGKEVSMNYDGTYTFTATEKNYTLEGTFDKQVFVYNSNWNLLKQNEGVVSLPNGGKGAKDTSGTKSWLQFDGQYTDIDLTLKVRDYHKDKHADERTDVLFIFENGAHISFGITTFKNGAVAIQTFNKSAADDGNEIYKTWNDFGQMTNEEKAQYQADGIDFRIVRYDTDVYLYIGGRLVNIADLTNKDRGVTADMKADVYIRHWGDAGVQVDIPFTVSDTVDNVSGTRVFPHPIQKLSYPEKVVTYEVTDVDLTLQVKRHTTIKPSEKFDILLDFDNGKNLSFYLGAETYEGKSQWCIATLNRSGDNTGAIYNRGTIWGALSTTEDSTFKNDQYIDFRVVRDGTDVLLYIGDRYLGTADLTNNNSGINENTTMKVTIRHYGQPQDNATEEVQVDVPFELTKKLEHVTITSNACEHGRVVADREKYFLGDTVTLFGEGDEGYSCVAMKVNGEDVAMNSDGTYTFTATEKSYTVEGIFERRLFVPNSSWDLSKADEGVVSLPAGTTADWLQLSNQYTNIDITVTAKDDKNDPKAARTDIFFVFDVNGTKRNLSFGITRNGAGVYRINSDTNADSTLYGQPIRNEYTIYGNGELLSDEITSYHADGVELRAVRYGLYIYLYVGDRLVDAVDLTTDSSSRATSVTAETRATVYIRHTNDTSVERVIPFTVSDRVTHVIGKQEFSHPKGQLTYPEKAIAHAVTDVDLTLKVKRHTAVKPSEKFDILLDFGNGKNLSFYLGALTYEGKSQWCIANLNRSGNNTGAIYNRDTIWGALSTTEDSAFKNNQYIDFRIVRDGTDVLIYIGDRHIGTADLTNNNSGINENTTMKVTIRHYGQPQDSATGTVNIDVPFELKTEPDNVETTSLLRNILALFSRKRRLL